MFSIFISFYRGILNLCLNNGCACICEKCDHVNKLLSCLCFCWCSGCLAGLLSIVCYVMSLSFSQSLLFVMWRWFCFSIHFLWLIYIQMHRCAWTFDRLFVQIICKLRFFVYLLIVISSSLFFSSYYLKLAACIIPIFLSYSLSFLWFMPNEFNSNETSYQSMTNGITHYGQEIAATKNTLFSSK